MPQELALILIVLGAVCWVGYKVLEGLHATAQSAHKELSGSLKGAKTKRVLKKRSAQSPHIQVLLPNDLNNARRSLQVAEDSFAKRREDTVWNPQRPAWEQLSFSRRALLTQRTALRGLYIEDLDLILRPDLNAWSDTERALISLDCSYPAQILPVKKVPFDEFRLAPLSVEPATFTPDRTKIREKDIVRYWHKERDEVLAYNVQREELLSKHQKLAEKIATWNEDERKNWSVYSEQHDAFAKEEAARRRQHAAKYESECCEQKADISEVLDGFRGKSKPFVLKRVEAILASISLPESLPRLWAIDYGEREQILIVEISLPDVVHKPPVKTVLQKSGWVSKPLNQAERKELIPKVHPAIMLRTSYEILRNRDSDVIKLLALNGWVDFIDPHTGQDTRAYTASLLVSPEQLAALNLQRIDPFAAFGNLKGRSSGKLIDIIPIEPALNLRRADSRFVDARAVLDALGTTTNLAAMDWQDFEHLIRELFEKEFAERGAEVKITQASRDRGVDAIAFNPDPIQGGKYIIQAKRYTNTVDVSAVRDLCAVVRKEGASRGILVTTSSYGADAYEFANNEPVTLLSGAELLGLLQKHGYTFRIDLAEARRTMGFRQSSDGK